MNKLQETTTKLKEATKECERRIEELTKSDCIKILELFRNWNMGQRSWALSFTGNRTIEDDLLDQRREMLKAVMRRVKELAEHG